MVQKIQNLDVEITDDQIEIDWAAVFSRRNKLLEISDWTQLSDVFLNPEIKKQWSMWRQKLRKVNRKTFTIIQDAKDVLALLEKEMPKSSPLDEAEFNDRIVNAEVFKDRVVQKIVTKEQPIIFQEIIEEHRFKELLIALLEKDAYGFKNYLLSFLNIDNTNIFASEDTLEDCKNKAKAFIRDRQTVSLNNKLKYMADVRIIQQRAEEALEYLSSNDPDVESFPLIRLHSENINMSLEQSAIEFLKQKKWYNALLLDSERFMFYTGSKIDAATSREELQSIIESVKNGY